MKRPGGLEITKKAFDICGLPKSAKVLDIGCGQGDTAAFLKDEYGFSMTGVDKSAEAISHANEKHPGCKFLEGDGQWLDFESLSFDCVLMECTLSLTSNPVEAIHEAFCVLKEGGWLVIHDLYLPQPSEEDLDILEQIKKSKEMPKDGGACCEDLPSSCTVNGALVLNDIYEVLAELGIEVVLFEDRKTDLDNFVASLIFSGGSLEDYCELKKSKSKASYFLLIARKAETLN